MLNQLNQLTPRAIARLGQLIESDSEQVALGAVKEVLDRNLGKPKASLDVKVEASLSALHLQALEELAARQVIARDARMIDVTPVATASPMPSVIEAMDYSDGKG
jgi:formate dehydrogenase maturation protein FdhE